MTFIPYNLIDRVLAATTEGDERDDTQVQSKASTLRESVERRIQGLNKLEKTS